jgi:hypothetical protein
MTATTTLVTVAGPADVAAAVVLRDSCARLHPGWRTLLVLADDPDASDRRDPAGNPNLDRFDDVWTAASLGGVRHARWSSAYSGETLQLVLAVAAAEALLQLPGTGAVVCVEPATLLLGDLLPLVGPLDGATVALVPRLLAPGPTPRTVIEDELAVLRSGTFAPGLMAFSPRGRDVARWFLARLDVAGDLTDVPGELDPGRLLDLVPSLFPDVAVVHDAGLAVIEVNLAARGISLAEDGEYVVGDGDPLRTLRFGEPDSTGPARSTMQDPSNTHLVELWRHYLDLLQAARRPPDPGT